MASIQKSRSTSERKFFNLGSRSSIQLFNVITETLKDEYKKGECNVENSANNANTSKTKQKDRIRSEIISSDIENLSKRLKVESADRASRKSVLELQRASLPIYPMRKHILDVIKANQVVIICGETGSGKNNL